jgi:phosphoglycolate phosphatase
MTTQVSGEVPLGAGMILGADLDLTLIATRAATAVALDRVNTTCAASIDIQEFLSRLGLPIRDELARWIPAGQVPEAVRVFRAAFLEEGLARLRPLPGAVDLVARLQEGGGRLVVITSRIPTIARACLETVGLPAAEVLGDVTGLQKTRPMLEHHVQAYVGDHLLDMRGTCTARAYPRSGSPPVPTPEHNSRTPVRKEWLTALPRLSRT